MEVEREDYSLLGCGVSSFVHTTDRLEGTGACVLE